VVPVGRGCRLSAFIAHYDGWYRRHVHALHAAGQPTVPHIILPSTPAHLLSSRSDATNASFANLPVGALDGASGPVEQHGVAPLQQTIFDYFSTAHASLDLKLWNLQCWLNPPDGSGGAADAPFVTFAFCGSVECVLVGGGDSSGRDLTVSYTVADPWGVEYNNAAVISGRFSALSFSAWSTDPVHLPSSGRLQMRCNASALTGGKSAGKAFESPLRHIKAASITAGASAAPTAAADGGKTPRATTRPAASNGERFVMLVDGEPYGPFACVQIAPCVPPGGKEAITLPVSTFFPIEPLAS